jgi:glycosyltransferase involved in cell wall biosynthesis
MADETVYLIGLPELSHPGGTWYLGFRRYLQTEFVKPPVKFRFFRSYWGWRLDNAITAVSRRPYYTLGLLMMECRAALHMLRHRKTLYHAIKADVDLNFLPRVSRLTGNYLIGSFHEPREQLKFWKIDKRMTRYLAAVILLGESQRAHFDGLMPPERVFVVPHGVDTEFFRPGGEVSGDPVCVTVGSHMRDAATLMKAMKLIWEEDSRVRLIVIGTRRPSDPNPPPDLRDERVRYLDRVADDELLASYHASRCAILSLKDAVANNALLEAMACGLPVVATDVGSIREYLGDEAGVLFPPADPESLAAGVFRVLGDTAGARRMSAAGRSRALTYDYKPVAGRLREIYSKILDGSIDGS